MATVLAGPGAARYVADFGADVVKVESPEGDGLRDLGWRDPSDAMWVAVSTSTESVARRVLALIGVGGDERFGTFAGRMKHRDELEGALAGWIAARPSGDVLGGDAGAGRPPRRTPGRITGPGRPLGADTDEVLSETARPEEVE
jgi:crotonobetainyl-CoA:carnitine CoA-transferase CaiB-like acyl-CoA transferase